MIPLKLELKNFLSYGDKPVSVLFGDHSLICLSGKNGNGKSALLDAITWSLWGQARKVSGTIKADAGLLRLGQTRMVVTMEFLCNGERYQVRREYSKTYGKPYVALDFALFREAEKAFCSLSEKTMKETQQKINETVGIDFDTFVNSVFLRQGQSNEFSKKTPKERKQILANILGLSRYEELSRLANDYFRKKNGEKKLFLEIVGQSGKELAEEPVVKKDLDEKKKKLKSLASKLKALEVSLKKLEAKKLLFMKHRYELDQATKEKGQTEKNLESKTRELKKTLAEWKSVHTKFLHLPDLAVLEKERLELRKRDSLLSDLSRKEMAFQKSIVARKNEMLEISRLRQKKYEQELRSDELAYEHVVLEHKRFVDQIDQKEKALSEGRKKEGEFVLKLKSIDEEQKRFAGFSKKFEIEKEQFEKRRFFYQKLVQQGNYVQREHKDLQSKRAFVCDKQNPSCPLCSQILTAKRKQFLSKTIVAQESFFQHRLNRVTNLMKKLKTILFAQHKEVQKMILQNEQQKQFLANCEIFEKRIVELKSERKKTEVEREILVIQGKKVSAEIKTRKESLDKKKKQEESLLEGDKEVVTLKKLLADLEKSRVSLEYDALEHEKIVEQLGVCEKKFEGIDSFSKERLRQNERRRFIRGLSDEIKNLRGESDRLSRKVKKISTKVVGEKSFEKDLIATKDKENLLIEEKERLLQEKGSLESKLERFSLLKKEIDVKKLEISKLDETVEEYALLVKMFGKDGIQALLIEQAIPEIEQEANHILSRLTDNKSQIFIESLRDLKKGGVKESLDIHISDSAGIRPYELFSGGEAFRIDFSLRIAISKLLARRSGAALQTLIIDEGFGSQDEEGLQRIMDAIHVIRKDFSKVVVVSHLPLFKNNFPIHFVVEKDSLGSFVKIEERG